MGSEKQSTNQSGTSTQSTTYSPAPYEPEINKLQYDSMAQTQPSQTQANQSGLDLVNQLLKGGSLPGYLNKLPGGISEDVTSDIVKQSLRDIQPQFQQSGLLDSGVNASISARTAGDIRRASEEYNQGNLFNLLNLATGSSAQIQSPILAQSEMLSGRLAGLRSSTTSGSYSGESTTKGMNPFLKSLQTGFGSSLAGRVCWVAAEVFDGWDDIRTIQSRRFILKSMPKWFLNMYLEFGESFAQYLKSHRVTRCFVKQIFKVFSYLGSK